MITLKDPFGNEYCPLYAFITNPDGRVFQVLDLAWGEQGEEWVYNEEKTTAAANAALEESQV